MATRSVTVRIESGLADWLDELGRAPGSNRSRELNRILAAARDLSGGAGRLPGRSSPVTAGESSSPASQPRAAAAAPATSTALESTVGSRGGRAGGDRAGVDAAGSSPAPPSTRAQSPAELREELAARTARARAAMYGGRS